MSPSNVAGASPHDYLAEGSASGAASSQRPPHVELVCSAFCKGSLDAFVECASAVSREILASPVWADLPSVATIGASATRFQGANSESLLREVAAWREHAPAGGRECFAFQLCSGDPFDPSQSLEVVADRDASAPRSRVRHLFELRLPLASLQGPWGRTLGDRLLGALQQLPFESGYIAPGLACPTHPRLGRPDGRHAAPAFVDHALDVHLNAATRFVVGGRCRGARWTVLLDRTLAQQAVDSRSIDQLRAAGLRTRPLDHGLALQATENPGARALLGSDVWLRYQALALALEDITLFDDLDLERSRFAGNADALDRYERRFLRFGGMR